jgi:hypothetical protein
VRAAFDVSGVGYDYDAGLRAAFGESLDRHLSDLPEVRDRVSDLVYRRS